MMTIAEPPSTIHYAAAPAEPDENWRLRSTCANHPDINLWFPDGATGVWTARTECAKRLCLTACPVFDQCRKLLDQMEAEYGSVSGIWAGTDEYDRNGERLRARKAAARARYNEKRRAAA